MKYVTKKILTVGLAVAVAFTLIPASLGSLEVNAASAPARVSSIKASANSSAVTVKWTKVKKNLNGYTIYRNGKAIKSVGKATASFSDKSVKAGTKYTYTVKAYRNVKQKQWYNKRTGKWQVKKPAKKIRGSSRKVTVKLYGKASPAITIKAVGSAGSSIDWHISPDKESIKYDKAKDAISFTWTANSEMDKIVIVRYKNGKEDGKSITLSGKARSYTDTNLNWDKGKRTAFKYSIKGYGSDGKNKCSAEVSYAATVISPEEGVTVVNEPLISLAWDPMEGVSYYIVYRSEKLNDSYINDKEFRVDNPKGAYVGNYDDTEIEPRIRYSYVVRAYDADSKLLGVPYNLRILKD